MNKSNKDYEKKYQAMKYVVLYSSILSFFAGNAYGLYNEKYAEAKEKKTENKSFLLNKEDINPAKTYLVNDSSKLSRVLKQ